MNPREGRTFPAYLFGGRLRTSTLALIVAFAAIWWLYEAYEPAAEPPPNRSVAGLRRTAPRAPRSRAALRPSALPPSSARFPS